jgi:hypothetical protein
MEGATAAPGRYVSELAFTRSANVAADADRKGLLRARTLAPEEQGQKQSFDLRPCTLHDLACEGAPAPDLLNLGFDSVDLSSLHSLQETLDRVRDAGRVSREQARSIRADLSGTSLRLSDGSAVKLLFIAPEGFIMRKAGPNGLSVATEALGDMNGHDGALSVHADQDVKGTPLRQMMRGAAPWLFRHETPDARNHWSPLMLLNLWIPLRQITRPLALMDRRTLNRPAQQLRYGLPTGAFLDREEEQSVNDIWTFLHDERQRWYFTSEMDSRRAYVFETLSTPHGSFRVPGEDAAEAGYLALTRAAKAVEQADEAGLQGAAADALEMPEVTTQALGRAVEEMDRLLAEARSGATELCREPGRDAWLARVESALERVVRKSIEMRIVALRIPFTRRA